MPTRKQPTAAKARPTQYKVFVSSTYLDNQDRRKVVQDAITMADMVWHGMVDQPYTWLDLIHQDVPACVFLPQGNLSTPADRFYGRHIFSPTRNKEIMWHDSTITCICETRAYEEGKRRRGRTI